MLCPVTMFALSTLVFPETNNRSVKHRKMFCCIFCYANCFVLCSSANYILLKRGIQIFSLIMFLYTHARVQKLWLGNGCPLFVHRCLRTCLLFTLYMFTAGSNSILATTCLVYKVWSWSQMGLLHLNKI